MKTGNTQMNDSLVFTHFTHNTFYRISCLLIVFTCLLYSAAAPASQKVLKISADPWEPWILGNGMHSATEGLAIDMAKEIFQRMKLPIEIKIYPYKRCMSQMQNGERDILLMAKKTPARQQFMLFSDVVVTDPQLIYYNTSRIKQFEWSNWKELKGYSIGGVLGFNYGPFHEAAEKYDIPFELTSDDNQNIKKLLAGRLDFILLSRSTAEYFLSQNEQYRHVLKPASRLVTNAQFHFALSKKGAATQYLEQLNRHIKRMKADGTLKNIIGF